MFDQKQIAELKEAFSFIDSNNDGLIDKEDLIDVWTSLGITNVLMGGFKSSCRSGGDRGVVGGDVGSHWTA